MKLPAEGKTILGLQKPTFLLTLLIKSDHNYGNFLPKIG